ncbi:MAG: PD-(D/E)XK nuclease family protein [Bacteroidia bacterium]|nr:PD-(D/E)XK nuclease family protein [Bacteroidia bacterium]
MEEDLDARVLGNFVHMVMERYYKGIIAAKGNGHIEPADLEKPLPVVLRIVDDVFRETYRLDVSKPVAYAGQRLVVREIVLRFAERILAMDRSYAPFSIEALEHRGMTHTFKLKADGSPEVVVGGIIDRADMKGDVVRVIDYKTGKDRIDIKNDVHELFKRDTDRNKAAFQTLLYAFLYKMNARTDGLKVIPGLMNRINLFDDNYTFGLTLNNKPLGDVDPLIRDFLDNLVSTLEELFDKRVPFDQTTNVSTCRLCSYQALCYR